MAGTVTGCVETGGNKKRGEGGRMTERLLRTTKLSISEIINQSE